MVRSDGMAEIFRFTPQGGEEARNNREKDREREETERLLWEAGFAADPEFEFRTLDTEPVSYVLSCWNKMWDENNLSTIPFVATAQEYDGVGVAAEASLDQVRLALVHHFRQISVLPTTEERQKYWNDNPVVYRYLKRATANTK